MRLGIALAARGAGRAQPKRGGGQNHVQFLPERNRELIVVGQRLEPRMAFVGLVIDLHPVALRLRAKINRPIQLLT